ncbi:M15 family metallopeptidase [Nocardioides sp. NBC_00368]|uniref:M15 family metallopeptidase n=1 Tax=Nocardioides sp. NBC_00368 TaxID=2976000 RepID=UPI002E201BF7
MAVSENGWEVLSGYSDKRLYQWKIPTKQGVVKITMRQGSVGFVLAHAVMLWADNIEPVYGKVLDDWGFAPRSVRGSSTPSNHSSGTAVDVNATKHPLGIRNTMHGMRTWLLKNMSIRYFSSKRPNVIRWGGEYVNRADEMHLEVRPGVSMAEMEQVAKRLMKSPGGKKLLAANPSQKGVILS